MYGKVVFAVPLMLAASWTANAVCLPKARDLLDATPEAMQRRDEDLCAKAPNCEMFTTSYGIRKARFIEGMEPGSQWYKDNVESIAANATINTATYFEDRKLGKRQVENCDEENCSEWSASENKELFGQYLPRTAMDSLYDNCAPTSCNIVIELDTFVIGNSVSNAVIRLTPDGRFSSADREQLIYGITDIMGALQESIEVMGDWDDMHKGPKYININRYTNGILNGGLSVFAELEVEDNRDCGNVIDLIGQAAAAIIPTAGIFFGSIQSLCDGIV